MNDGNAVAVGAQAKTVRGKLTDRGDKGMQIDGVWYELSKFQPFIQRGLQIGDLVEARLDSKHGKYVLGIKKVTDVPAETNTAGPASSETPAAPSPQPADAPKAEVPAAKAEPPKSEPAAEKPDIVRQVCELAKELTGQHRDALMIIMNALNNAVRSVELMKELGQLSCKDSVQELVSHHLYVYIAEALKAAKALSK